MGLRERKLQKLKRDLYISDNESSDSEDLNTLINTTSISNNTDINRNIIDSNPNLTANSDINNTNTNQSAINTINSNNNNINPSDINSNLLSDNIKRQSRRRTRQDIDYNENKRPKPLYPRKKRNESDNEQINSTNSTSNYSVISHTSNNNSNNITTSNSNHNIKNFNTHMSNSIIDKSFLNSIVEKGINKKLSILGNYNEIDKDSDTDEIDDDEIDYNNNITNNNISNTSNSKFNDEINSKIKSLYEIQANEILNLKNKQLNDSILNIDEEINKVKKNFINFKKTCNWNDNFDNTLYYPEVFLNSFKLTKNKIQNEKNLLLYKKKLYENIMNSNISIIHDQFNINFIENRSSIINIINQKINQLENSATEYYKSKSESKISAIVNNDNKDNNGNSSDNNGLDILAMCCSDEK